MPFPANPDKQHVKDSQPRQGCSQAPETSQSHMLSESTLPRCTVIFPSEKWVGTEDLGPRAVPPAVSPLLRLCPLPCHPRAGTALPCPRTPKRAALPRDGLCPSSSGGAGHAAVGSAGLRLRVDCLRPTRG